MFYCMYNDNMIRYSVKNMLERGPDFCCWLDTTQFLCHCVHLIHEKLFLIQMLLHFSLIVPRVCILVLFNSKSRLLLLFSVNGISLNQCVISS